MDRIEHRAVIKFLTKEDESAKRIHNRMVAVYGNTTPKYSTVSKWAAKFKHGQDSRKDDPRSGRPLEVITDETIVRVEEIIMKDRHVKID